MAAYSHVVKPQNSSFCFDLMKVFQRSALVIHDGGRGLPQCFAPADRVLGFLRVYAVFLARTRRLPQGSPWMMDSLCQMGAMLSSSRTARRKRC